MAGLFGQAQQVPSPVFLPDHQVSLLYPTQSTGTVHAVHGYVQVPSTPVGEEGVALSMHSTPMSTEATPLSSGSPLLHAPTIWISHARTVSIPWIICFVQLWILAIVLILVITLGVPGYARAITVSASVCFVSTIAQLIISRLAKPSLLILAFGMANFILVGQSVIATLILAGPDSFRAGVDWAVYYCQFQALWLLIMNWFRRENMKYENVPPRA